MKHVPIAEYNPMECIKTNVNGAQNVMRSPVAGCVIVNLYACSARRAKSGRSSNASPFHFFLKSLKRTGF